MRGPLTVHTLKKRAEFLRLRGGLRWSGSSFVLETKPRESATSDGSGPRFGFTVTKAMGSAVTRNRIRRRLKAAVATLAEGQAKAGFDYVIVARPGAATRQFALLKKDLEQALQRVHHPLPKKQGR